MENLIVSVNVILPIFLLLVIGYILKKIKLLDNKTKRSMDQICFKVFFPVLLFNSIYKTDIETSFNPKLLAFAVIGVCLMFVSLCFIVPLFEKDKRRRGVLIQGIFRSNFVIFGLPVAIALCGSENIGATSILIAVIVPLFNALSIVALEIHRGSKINILKIVRSVITNPFIIGGGIGVIALLLKIELPTAIASTVSSVSGIATPLALILLGASFSFGDVHGNLKTIMVAVISKLVAVPLIFIPIAVAFGFRNEELVALTIMLAAPTAVSTFTMAGNMDGDQVLAGQIVVFDSICSIVTIFLWIFSLKQLGLF